MDQNSYFGTSAGPVQQAIPARPGVGQGGMPSGWRPPASQVPPAAVKRGSSGSGSKSRVAWIAVAAVVVAALVAGGMYLSKAGKSAASSVTKPIDTATSTAVKADVVTMGTAIAGYYAGNDGPLTLTTKGMAWAITTPEGNIVQQGQLSESGETVSASKLTGAGAWCVALAPKGNIAGGAHFAAVGGVHAGGTCP